MAGRPRKDPSQLVHNTRQRVFHQVEATPDFDVAIEKAKHIIARLRTIASGKNVSPEQISKASAIRYATEYFVKEHVAGDDRA